MATWIETKWCFQCWALMPLWHTCSNQCTRGRQEATA